MPILTGPALEEVELSLTHDLNDLSSLSYGPWSTSSLEEIKNILRHANDAVDALLSH